MSSHRPVRHLLLVWGIFALAVAAFSADTSVRDARAHGLDPRLPYLYVVDLEHRLAAKHARPLKLTVAVLVACALWSVLLLLLLDSGRARLATLARGEAQLQPQPEVQAHGLIKALRACGQGEGKGEKPESEKPERKEAERAHGGEVSRLDVNDRSPARTRRAYEAPGSPRW